MTPKFISTGILTSHICLSHTSTWIWHRHLKVNKSNDSTPPPLNLLHHQPSHLNWWEILLLGTKRLRFILTLLYPISHLLEIPAGSLFKIYWIQPHFTTCTTINHSIQATFISWLKYSNKLLSGLFVSTLVHTTYSQPSSQTKVTHLKYKSGVSLLLNTLPLSKCSTKALYELTTVTSMTSFPMTLPFALSTPDVLASLVFHEVTRHALILQLLYWLFPLSGKLFPRYSHGSFPNLFQVFAEISPSQWGLYRPLFFLTATLSHHTHFQTPFPILLFLFSWH